MSQKDTRGYTAFVADCTIEEFLNNCLTEFVLCGVACFPFLATSFSNNVNTMEGNGNS